MVQRRSEKKAVLTEEEKRIRKEEEETELRKMEEESRTQETLNQQIKVEEEKIRVERQDYLWRRSPTLTPEQRRLRKIISARASRRRAREARAAKDDKFRQREEARWQGDDKNRYRKWLARPAKLTDKQREIRDRLSSRKAVARIRAKQRRAQRKDSPINETFNTEKQPTNTASPEADPLRPGGLAC